MKTKYYLGLKPLIDNRYFIHSEDCPLLPAPEKRIYIGRYLSPEDALMEARKCFNKIDFCRFCQIRSVKKIDSLLKEKHYANTGFISSDMIIRTWDAMLVCCIN